MIYRVQYEGYIEDEFDDEEEALSFFLKQLHDLHETDRNLHIEVWTGQEWETL